MLPVRRVRPGEEEEQGPGTDEDEGLSDEGRGRCESSGGKAESLGLGTKTDILRLAKGTIILRLLHYLGLKPSALASALSMAQRVATTVVQ